MLTDPSQAASQLNRSRGSEESHARPDVMTAPNPAMAAITARKGPIEGIATIASVGRLKPQCITDSNRLAPPGARRGVCAGGRPGSPGVLGTGRRVADLRGG